VIGTVGLAVPLLDQLADVYKKDPDAFPPTAVGIRTRSHIRPVLGDNLGELADIVGRAGLSARTTRTPRACPAGEVNRCLTAGRKLTDEEKPRSWAATWPA